MIETIREMHWTARFCTVSAIMLATVSSINTVLAAASGLTLATATLATLATVSALVARWIIRTEGSPIHRDRDRA